MHHINSCIDLSLRLIKAWSCREWLKNWQCDVKQYATNQPTIHWLYLIIQGYFTYLYELGNISIIWNWLKLLAKFRTLWPIFHGTMVCLFNSKAFWHTLTKFCIVVQIEMGYMCVLKLESRWHHDQYFMVQWFALITPWLFIRPWNGRIMVWRYPSVRPSIRPSVRPSVNFCLSGP